MSLSLNEQHALYEKFSKKNPDCKPFEKILIEEHPINPIYILIVYNSSDKHVVIDTYYTESVARDNLLNKLEATSIPTSYAHVIETCPLALLEDKVEYQGRIEPFTDKDKKIIFDSLENATLMGSVKYLKVKREQEKTNK